MNTSANRQHLLLISDVAVVDAEIRVAKETVHLIEGKGKVMAIVRHLLLYGENTGILVKSSQEELDRYNSHLDRYRVMFHTMRHGFTDNIRFLRKPPDPPPFSKKFATNTRN